MNKMKKFLSTVATLILSVTSAMPLIASAENYASGDLNNDGVINGSDCMLILNYYCDLSSDKVDLTSPETQIVLKYGDMNGDGIINTSDAMVIYKAGMKTLDPNEDGRVDEYDAVRRLMMKITGQKSDKFCLCGSPFEPGNGCFLNLLI